MATAPTAASPSPATPAAPVTAINPDGWAAITIIPVRAVAITVAIIRPVAVAAIITISIAWVNGASLNQQREP